MAPILLLLIMVTDLCMFSFLVIVSWMSNIFGHHSRPFQQAQKTMNMFVLLNYQSLCCLLQRSLGTSQANHKEGEINGC
jgi:VanZ family protein